MNQPSISESIPADIRGSKPDAPQEVSASVRLPIAMFVVSAVGWLLVSSCFGLLASTECHLPHSLSVLSGVPWLSFGRVFPAFQDTFVYGWLSSAGIGVAIWLLSRLNDESRRTSYLLMLSVITWNLGVGIGTLAILSGGGTGREFLNFPFYATFLQLLALLFFGIWAVLIIWNRRSRLPYISEWYIFAAIFCFIWSLTSAGVLLNLPQSPVGPAPGVSQGVIHAWFERNLLWLWLAPIALATVYYLIPKLLATSIHSYKLAQLGFWAWIACSAFGGLAAFIGAPFPAWMVTLGIVANVLALIPVLAVAANLHMTTRSVTEQASPGLVLRFLTLGAMVFTFYGFEAAINSLRTVGQFTEFTLVILGQNYLFMYGFCSLIMFGAIYYLLPRIVHRPIIFEGVANLQFWLSIVGLVLLWLDLTMGGLIQGFGLQDPKVSMDSISDLLKPFLMFQSLAALILFAANFAFAISVMLLFLLPDRVRKRSNVPDVSMEKAAEVTVA
jgi:cytochrome c oxidase cbb3-type subunit 1